MKAAGLICVMLCGVLIGVWKALSLNRRTHALAAAQRLVIWMTDQLRYASPSTAQLLQKASEQADFQYLFPHYRPSDTGANVPFSEVWRVTVLNDVMHTNFTKEDAELLCAFGDEIGRTDREGQISCGKRYAQLLTRQYEQALEDEKQKGKVAVVTWSSGTAALILLLM